MSIIRGLICAISSFSCIPVPSFDYKDGDLRFMMAMFPLVGVVVGAFLLLWHWICLVLGIGSVLRGIGLLLVPIVVTGGIHLDGYCDVCDAISSHASREKKIEILKDPHVGAFAVIWISIYLLFYLGCLIEIEPSISNVALIALSCVLSRCASTYASLLLPKRSGNGMLQAQTKDASKSASLAIVTAIAMLAIAGMLIIEWASAIFMVAFASIAFLSTYLMEKRQFGGMSGDVAGFLVQVCELSMAVGLLLAGKVF